MQAGENSLISSILDGNVDAYALLVRRYQKPIYNLMLRMSLPEEDAADLTQETFVRAYEKLERFKPSGRFFPWLYTIGLNLARDHLRKANRENTLQRGLQRAANPTYLESENETGFPKASDVERVRASLEELPFEYREAVFLRFHEDMSMKEIARILGISVSGAKMRVHRGLLKLRKVFLGEKS
jgi:RNA polymerase sigma-70 factor (ECF subfamily)